MRIFVAAEIPEKYKDEIITTILPLKADFQRGIKWVKKENIHLTIKFLGEVCSKKSEEVKQALSEIKPLSMPLKISSFGAFPSLSRPSVLWAGLVDEKGILKNLASEIEVKLSAIGFKKETRPFTPHITLARIKGKCDESFPDEIKKLERCFKIETFYLQGFSLYESRLLKDGAVYTLIKAFKP
jgi:2'-5' RNA ligase